MSRSHIHIYIYTYIQAHHSHHQARPISAGSASISATEALVLSMGQWEESKDLTHGFQVSRNGPGEFWIPFMSGKHGKTCGKTWLMPIDANWCQLMLCFFWFSSRHTHITAQETVHTWLSRCLSREIMGCPLFEKIEMANGQDSRHEITWVAMVGSLGHEPK